MVAALLVRRRQLLVQGQEDPYVAKSLGSGVGTPGINTVSAYSYLYYANIVVFWGVAYDSGGNGNAFPVILPVLEFANSCTSRRNSESCKPSNKPARNKI